MISGKGATTWVHLARCSKGTPCADLRPKRKVRCGSDEAEGGGFGDVGMYLGSDPRGRWCPSESNGKAVNCERSPHHCLITNDRLTILATYSPAGHRRFVSTIVRTYQTSGCIQLSTDHLVSSPVWEEAFPAAVRITSFAYTPGLICPRYDVDSAMSAV